MNYKLWPIRISRELRSQTTTCGQDLELVLGIIPLKTTLQFELEHLIHPLVSK